MIRIRSRGGEGARWIAWVFRACMVAAAAYVAVLVILLGMGRFGCCPFPGARGQGLNISMAEDIEMMEARPVGPARGSRATGPSRSEASATR